MSLRLRINIFKSRKLIIVLVVISLNVGLLYFYVPSFDSIKSRFSSSDRYFYDRSGELIQVERSALDKRYLRWVPLDEVSQNFIEDLIFAEDKRFWHHFGVDPIGVARALFKSQKLGKQGASTISMQLVNQISDAHRFIKKRSRMLSKFYQVVYAIGLELRWSKKEILSAYLNHIAFQGELVGLPAATQLLLNKHPGSLSRLESAFLVSMIRSPNSSQKVMFDRACKLMESKKEDESFNREECIQSIDRVVNSSRVAQKNYLNTPNLIPHLAKLILKNSKSKEAEIYTTINSGLQRFSQNTIRNQIAAVKNQNAHDASLIVINNKTHEIEAYVASSLEHSTASYVDGVRALRQVGSTLKPFIYTKGIDLRILSAATVLDDSPAEVAIAGGGVYRPRNFDEKFRGPVTVRDALAGSLNIPAVRALELVGIDHVIAMLNEFGIKDLREADYYGPSLALGAADLSLYDLTIAYHNLANLGAVSNVSFLKFAGKKTDENIETKQAVSKEAAYIVGDILRDNFARAKSFGLNSALTTSIKAAVKTGTSKDMRDNWCIGFTEHYTVGVWVGNYSGESMWNLTGVSGAAPIWSSVMNYLHKDFETKEYRADYKKLDLVSKPIKFSFRRDKITELFIRGTEAAQDMVGLVDEKIQPKIISPIDQSLLAVDMDIPKQNQKVSFEATNYSQDYVWVLNSEEVQIGDREFDWPLKRGNYLLALKDSKNNRVIDSVRFQVR